MADPGFFCPPSPRIILPAPDYPVPPDYPVHNMLRCPPNISHPSINRDLPNFHKKKKKNVLQEDLTPEFIYLSLLLSCPPNHIFIATRSAHGIQNTTNRKSKTSKHSAREKTSITRITISPPPPPKLPSSSRKK